MLNKKCGFLKAQISGGNDCLWWDIRFWTSCSSSGHPPHPSGCKASLPWWRHYDGLSGWFQLIKIWDLRVQHGATTTFFFHVAWERSVSWASKLAILEPRQGEWQFCPLIHEAPASDGDSDPARLVRKVLKKEWESWESLLFCALYGNGKIWENHSQHRNDMKLVQAEQLRPGDLALLKGWTALRWNKQNFLW